MRSATALSNAAVQGLDAVLAAGMNRAQWHSLRGNYPLWTRAGSLCKSGWLGGICSSNCNWNDAVRFASPCLEQSGWSGSSHAEIALRHKFNAMESDKSGFVPLPALVVP